MTIAANVRRIQIEIPEKVVLVAVTKNQNPAAILQAYQVGLRDFGENRAVELVKKAPTLPEDIRWHYIGHLQRNKVRSIIPLIHMIHSIDSLKLLEEVEKEASRAKKLVKVLLQFHIASEETKYGLSFEEAQQLLESTSYQSMEHIRICGVMGMASFVDDEEQIRQEFQHLYQIFLSLKERYFAHNNGFCEVSMGMSSDYIIAIEEGSTMVRIGSAIFHTMELEP